MGITFSITDIRGRADETLTREHVWNVGKALADWLPEEGAIIVVHSAGASGPIVHALTEGILLQGRDVVDDGEGDQQTVVAAIGDDTVAGGVLIVHDELQGIEIIRLYDNQGVAITADNGLGDIDQLVQAGNFVPAGQKGVLR